MVFRHPVFGFRLRLLAGGLRTDWPARSRVLFQTKGKSPLVGYFSPPCRDPPEHTNLFLGGGKKTHMTNAQADNATTPADGLNCFVA